MRPGFLLASGLAVGVGFGCADAPPAASVVDVQNPVDDVPPDPADPVVAAGDPPPLVVAGDPEPVFRDDGCAVPFPDNACRRLPVTSVRATAGQSDATFAFDGSACTVWNAGQLAPQTLIADLGEPGFVDGLVIVPDASGVVTVVIESSLDGKAFDPAHRVEADLRGGTPQQMQFPQTLRAQFLRIATERAPGAVAWRDVVVFHCAGQ